MKYLSSSAIYWTAFALLTPSIAAGPEPEQKPSSQEQEKPRAGEESNKSLEATGEAGASADQQTRRGATKGTPGAPVESDETSADFFDRNGGDQDRVREVQRVLQEKAYYTGPIDGIVNAETRSSLRDFQHDYNLPVTGRVDERTAERLGIE
jgi:peptidoglycan hydrolase-like protein with peptidoglycan-binding domain